MSRTDLRALVAALHTGNVRQIHHVLQHPVADDDPESSVEAGYSTRLLAAHFFRRFADALDHRWLIDADEVSIALNFLYDTQPDLKPKEPL
jgi:hypothetical protein